MTGSKQYKLTRLGVLPYKGIPQRPIKKKMKHEKYEGKIVHVCDGDTVVIENDYLTKRVRLHHIDAPEKNEPYAFQSKAWIINHWLGCTVDVYPIAYDKYGRQVAILYKDKQYNLSAEMLISGLAFWYRRFSKDVGYKYYESIAKANKVNLWSNPSYFQRWSENRLYKNKNRRVFTREDLEEWPEGGFYNLPFVPNDIGIDAMQQIEIGIEKINHKARIDRDGHRR